MFIRMDRMRRRLIALGIALVMVLGLFPTRIMAEGAAVTFTVQLNPAVYNAIVKITDKANLSSSISKNTDSTGKAEFTDNFDQNATYTIEVTGAAGYEKFTNEKSIVSGETLVVDLSMARTTVSGTVVDESSKPISGATVQLSGYSNASITTIQDGKFNFDIYQGKDYTITIKAGERYVDKDIPVNTFIVLELKEITINTKTFTVTTSAGPGGTITDSDPAVKYGTSKDIIVDAEDGYVIKSLTIDGQPVEAAKDMPSYIQKLTDITKNYEISATFVKTYVITVEYGENGFVMDENHNIIGSASTQGGTITVNQGDNKSLEIKSNQFCHVVSISVDGNVKDLKKDENKDVNLEVISEGTAYIYHFVSVTDTHKIQVVFSGDAYNVSVSSTGIGAITVNGNTANSTEIVKYRDAVKFTFTPNSVNDVDYTIGEIKIDGVAININDSNLENNEDGSIVYLYSVNPEALEHSINIVFEPVLSKPVGIDGQYYSVDIPIKDHIYNETRILVYPKDAKVKLMAKDLNQDTEHKYKKIRVKREGSWTGFTEDGITISGSTTISQVYVEKSTGPKKDTANAIAEPLQIVMDNEKPKIDKVERISSTGNWVDGDWTDGLVTITVNVSDNDPTVNSGIAGIRYGTSEDVDLSTNLPGSGSVFQFNTPVDNEGKAKGFKGKYYIWTYDAAGNISDPTEVVVNIDITNPRISKYEFEPIYDSFVAKTINFLSFGMLCNEKVKVTVSVDDDGISSGFGKVVLYGKKVGTETDEIIGTDDEIIDNKAEFILDAPEEGEEPFNQILSAVVIDKVGLKSEQTKPKENDEKSALMLEKIIPEVLITPDAAAYTDPDLNLWYKGDVAFNVSISDAHSGINGTEININGEPISTDRNGNPIKAISKNGSDPKISSVSYLLNTDMLLEPNNKKDGPYTLSVYVKDNAGNGDTEDGKKIETLYTVNKDTTSPSITEFEFSPSENGKKGLPVEVKDYGFFFAKDTEVIVTAVDAGAGVKSIIFKTVDISGKTEEFIRSFDTPNKAFTPIEASFTVKANFKGQIYAKTTDNVGNTSIDVNPEGTIIEDAEQHKATSSIILEVPETSYKDNEGYPLYNDNVKVDVTVVDSYSGIDNIEWTVIDSDNVVENDGKETVRVNNKLDLSGDTNGWNPTKVEENLVTEMKKTFEVSNNSNKITVRVTITDKAGNTSFEEKTFSIDTKEPTINVTYDNKSYDEGFKAQGEFYKSNRKATIVIEERNFNPDAVKINITNTDGVIPILSAWKEVPGTGNGDNTTHTATIDYVADGDYTFDISCTDLAGNAAAPFAQHAFTIDKTLPVISVVYDNNSAQNVNYYKAQRTATITIKEHNFETSRINIAGTAADNGKPVAYPAVSAWSSSGDIHTAKITFANDALYSFDIDYTDKAGNKAADFAQQQFYVDKTVPTLVISGVNDKSANKGNVIPIVTLSDTNYNKNNVSIKLTGSNNGPVSPIGSFADITNGQKYTFKNFEKKKEIDDLYTLAAVVVDMAGNRTEKIITFSVNRFGSVYTMGDILKNAEGKYVLKGFDVVIIETNVDSLKMDSIKAKITKNGTPMDLVMDKDYTIRTSGGEGEWSQYEYTINSSVFEGDAKYMVTLHSVDAAGNVNENIDETKNAEIWFGVDKTMPVVVPINLEDKTTYAVDLKQASISVSDNLVLSDVKVYLNDKEVRQSVSGDSYTFDIPGSTSSQRVRIVARDAAGNELVKEIKSFYVTTNIFVRWYTNTPLFIGTIAGVAVLAIGITSFVLFRKKGAKVNNKTEGGDGNGN